VIRGARAMRALRPLNIRRGASGHAGRAKASR